MNLRLKHTRRKRPLEIKFGFIILLILFLNFSNFSHASMVDSDITRQLRIQKFRAELKPFTEQMDKGNFGAAFTFLQEPRLNGNYLAAIEMALFHLRGFGAKLDRQAADRLCKDALPLVLDDISNSINGEDFDTLSQIYHEGCGVNEDQNEARKLQNKAIELYAKLGEAGDVNAMNRLRILFDIQKNGDAIVYWAEQCANSGLSHAAFVLGMYYAGGPFSPINPNQEKSETWYKKSYELAFAAAQNGVAIEQSKVGLFYHKGLVVKKDTDKAIEWYELAANAGVLSAQAPLAQLYFEKREYVKARKWFEAATKQWDADSMYQLATMMRDGLGGVKNQLEYLKLLKLAAEQESSEAQEELATLEP